MDVVLQHDKDTSNHSCPVVHPVVQKKTAVWNWSMKSSWIHTEQRKITFVPGLFYRREKKLYKALFSYGDDVYKCSHRLLMVSRERD